jgi:hypothetical protein
LLTDPGNKLGNYTVTVNAGNLTVERAPLTVSAADASRAYGAANPIFSGTIIGARAGDNITVTYDSSATSTSPAGTYAIVPRMSDPNGKLSNYSLTLNIGTLTITPAGISSITSISVLANHYARITGTGDPGSTYNIEATSDLVTWQVIGTAVTGNDGIYQFDDADAVSFAHRFYRTALP